MTQLQQADGEPGICEQPGNENLGIARRQLHQVVASPIGNGGGLQAAPGQQAGHRDVGLAGWPGIQGQCHAEHAGQPKQQRRHVHAAHRPAQYAGQAAKQLEPGLRAHDGMLGDDRHAFVRQHGDRQQQANGQDGWPPAPGQQPGGQRIGGRRCDRRQQARCHREHADHAEQDNAADGDEIFMHCRGERDRQDGRQDQEVELALEADQEVLP